MNSEHIFALLAFNETNCLVKALKIFCGLNTHQNKQEAKPQPDQLIHLTSIKEKRIPATIVNVFGIIMLCAMTFLFGYYA